MAVTIIGKDTNVYKEATCKNCATRLQFTPSDTQKGVDTDYTGGKDYYKYITCPCCGKEVIVRNC